MSRYTHAFEGRVVHYDLVKYQYTVVYLPAELAKQLPFGSHPRLRIEGEINGESFNAAWQPAKGRWYLLLGKQLRKAARVQVGDRVRIAFRIADQDAVDVPRELQLAIEADSRALSTWNSLTPGRRRGLTYRVASAKRMVTRMSRVEEVLETLAELDRKK